MPLADHSSGVAVLLADFRQRQLACLECAGSSAHNDAVQSGADAVTAGHQTSSRRRAAGLHKELGQHQAFLSQIIQIRCRHAAKIAAAAVAAEITEADVVGEH